MEIKLCRFTLKFSAICYVQRIYKLKIASFHESGILTEESFRKYHATQVEEDEYQDNFLFVILHIMDTILHNFICARIFVSCNININYLCSSQTEQSISWWRNLGFGTL